MLLPIVLEEERCIPENRYCEFFGKELYETHLLVTQFLELGMLLGFLCSFSCCTVPSILYA